MVNVTRSTRAHTQDPLPDPRAGPSQQAQGDQTPDLLTQETIRNTPPVQTTVDEEIALQVELEQEQRLLRIAEQRAALAAARARRIAIENVELPPVPTTPGAIANPVTLLPSNLFDLQLPKPEPPPRFDGKNRAQLNNWIRGCERYIHGSTALTTPAAQINFAQRYLGNDQIDLWERHLRTSGLDEISANWSYMKEVMLNLLGLSWERKQLARERIRGAS